MALCETGGVFCIGLFQVLLYWCCHFRFFVTPRVIQPRCKIGRLYRYRFGSSEIVNPSGDVFRDLPVPFYSP
jgi:hypothetical protein